MKRLFYIALLAVLLCTFSMCGKGDPVEPKPNKNDSILVDTTLVDTTAIDTTAIPPGKKTLSVDFHYSITVPSDLCERGEVVATYINTEGQKQVKTLTKEDFTEKDDKMTWEYACHFDHFDVLHYVVIKFLFTRSQSFVVAPTASVTSKKGEDVIDKYIMPMTISVQNITTIGGSGTNQSSVELFRLGFFVDAEGIINEASKEDMAFTKAQRAFIRECSSRLLSRIKADWENIPKSDPNNEKLTVRFEEQSPEGVFSEPVFLMLDVRPRAGEEEGLMWIYPSAHTENSSTHSTVLVMNEPQDELYARLDNEELLSETAHIFEKLIMDIFD